MSSESHRITCDKVAYMHLGQWIAIIVIIISLLRAVTRLLNPFWSRQPVFHPYRLDMWMRSGGVIDEGMPEQDRYVCANTQKTVLVDQLSDSDKASIETLLARDYLPRDQGKYSPKWKHVTCGMTGASHTSSFTLGVGEDNDLTSVISARPVEVIIKKTTPFWVYYVDNLCVKKEARAKGVAPKAIRTLYYDCRHREPSIKACLFKREGVSMGIVPLTSYKVHAYQSGAFEDWTLPVSRAEGRERARDCWEAAKDWSAAEAEMAVFTSPAAFIKSVEAETMYVFYSTGLRGPACVAVFRDPACDYGEGKAIELCCYVEDLSAERRGAPQLLSACYKACGEVGARTVIIDELGKYTTQALELLATRNLRPTFTSTTSLFFYNYRHVPWHPRDCVMLF